MILPLDRTSADSLRASVYKQEGDLLVDWPLSGWSTTHLSHKGREISRKRIFLTRWGIVKGENRDSSP